MAGLRAGQAQEPWERKRDLKTLPNWVVYSHPAHSCPLPELEGWVGQETEVYLQWGMVSKVVTREIWYRGLRLAEHLGVQGQVSETPLWAPNAEHF